MTNKVRPAKSVTQLVLELVKLLRKGATSWDVIDGPRGHASIIVFDKDGNEMTEIRNKE